MKRLLSIIGVVLLAAVAVHAGPPVTIQFAASSCETNAAATSTYTPDNDLVIHGYVDTIILDYTGAETGTVKVATLASQGTGPARTVLLDTDIEADGSFPVRDLVTTTAGADIANTPARIPLVGDKLRLQLYGWSDTNTTMAVWVVITDEP